MTITIRFVAASGEETAFEVKPAGSLMEAAVKHDLPGIEADCGGLATCATCHVYVREPWAGELPLPEGDEASMLEFTAAPRRENSRLSCQIRLTPALDGLTVDLPPNQH